MARFFYSIIILSLIVNNALGQERLGQLHHEKQILIEISNELRDSLASIDSRIDSIYALISEIEFELLSERSTTLTLSTDAPIFEESNVGSRRIGELSRGDQVYLVGAGESNFVEVNTGDATGFVAAWNFDEEDQLERLIQRLRHEGATIRARLGRMKAEFESDQRWVGSNTLTLRAGPSTNNEVLDTLNQGDRVFLIENQGDWIHVRYHKELVEPGQRFETEEELLAIYAQGWVLSENLSEQRIREKTRAERIAQIRQHRRQEFVDQNPNLSDQHRENILNGRVRIGMTDDMARASWGRPVDVNRTITATQVSEQWVYGSVGNRRYLYFRNGILTTIQN